MKSLKRLQLKLVCIIFLIFYILPSLFSQTEILNSDLLNIIKKHNGLSEGNIVNIQNMKYTNGTMFSGYHVIIDYSYNDANFESEFIVFPQKDVVIPRIYNLTGNLFKIDLRRLNSVLCEAVDYSLLAEFINFLIYCNNVCNNTQKEDLIISIQDSEFVKEELKSDYINLIKKTDLNLRVMQYDNCKKLIFFLSKRLFYNIIKIEILFNASNKIVSYNYKYLLNKKIDLVKFTDTRMMKLK